MLCGGYTPLFLGGSHPLEQDGIVTRDIYGSNGYVADGRQCRSQRSNPVQVKACPGNYYVYRLVKPAVSIPKPTYCAVHFSAPTYDPCDNYTYLDQTWRGHNATGTYTCDKDFNWTGWYRLMYNGMNIHMPESCVDENKCGTITPLWLNGSHPQIEDGIVTRQICGKLGSDCCYYRSVPIQVKACLGNYYVYKFVRPMLFCSAYCADVGTITSISTTTTGFMKGVSVFFILAQMSTVSTSENMTFDPCNVFTVVNDTWRSVFTSYSSYDDTLVVWSGWYRLYLHGKSAQLPECVFYSSYTACGGFTSLFLGGPHPLIKDGIVTREICGINAQYSYYKSNPIQVKACPGKYYVYRLVKPAVLLPVPTYCAVAFNTPSYDPCNNYHSLDQPWRGTNATGLGICDHSFNWIGWYRLLYYGMNIRMPESCIYRSRCGTDISLWLNGSHPQIEDGIVTRGVCGSSGSDCCYYRSTPIRVKACPGDYYVYEFVRPTVCNSAYCADVNAVTMASAPTTATNDSGTSITSTGTPENNISDPCNVSSVLDHYWRSVDANYNGFDDTLVEWSGWYRLYLQGKSAQLPESDWCWSSTACGGYTALFLVGPHPLPQEGIVTREIYGTYGSVTNSRQCHYYRSNPIQLKACPGNYYVYRLVRPALSVPMPTYCAVVFNTLSNDPCNKYTPLDQPWRATNATGLNICDSNFNWNGWYRLLYYGMNIHMPESCVEVSRCGTYYTLWLNGSHPQIEDGIVTRGVCARSGSDCCYYRVRPVRVKACPGNYYVYEFVRPTICNAAYCADVNVVTPTTAPTTTANDLGASIITTGSPANISFDPCNVFSVLDNYWRSVYTSYSGYDDTLVEWSGWYRLYLQGNSAQLPESDWFCSFVTCGGYTTLSLGGSHPLPQDGIVTREIYGTYGSVPNSKLCHYYRSNPIQVKACPGNYYVYRLVKPVISLPMPTYSAGFSNRATPDSNF
ncbi:hypothetical protein NFI96_018703 [Prochilodus magdalenae]|nr:hypothetical protein NFI96_018703 [Prochilodus magdalenae]